MTIRVQHTILLLLAVLLSGIASAQKVVITNPSMERIGDNLAISFDAILETIPYNVKIKNISTNHKLTLIPILWNADKELSFSPIVVMGRNMTIMQDRKGGLETGTIVASSNERTYINLTIPFEPWMDDVSLRMDRILEGCCDSVMLSPITILNYKAEPVLPPIVPMFAENLTPVFLGEFQSTVEDYPFVYVSGSEGEGNIMLYFKQGSTTIQESFLENKNSILKIREAIELIKSESNVNLTKVTVVGGASPEGTFLYNQKIGQGRADALINYFSDVIDSKMFEVDNIGENWEGLYRMVENSDMEYKYEVLSIIDKYPIFAGREGKLMRLKGGDPYRYMLKEFFPELRKASYVQIFYEVKPNEDLLKIETASELIEAESYQAAFDILQEIEPTSYTNNLMGVCSMMVEDFHTAREYLQKAVDMGSEDARKNLEQIAGRDSAVRW